MSHQDFQATIVEMLKAFKYLLHETLRKQGTKCYEGLVQSQNADGSWSIFFNNEAHNLKPYGSIIPAVGKIVKVIVPQGNMNLAFFF